MTKLTDAQCLSTLKLLHPILVKHNGIVMGSSSLWCNKQYQAITSTFEWDDRVEGYNWDNNNAILDNFDAPGDFDIGIPVSDVDLITLYHNWRGISLKYEDQLSDYIQSKFGLISALGTPLALQYQYDGSSSLQDFLYKNWTVFGCVQLRFRVDGVNICVFFYRKDEWDNYPVTYNGLICNEYIHRRCLEIEECEVLTQGGIDSESLQFYCITPTSYLRYKFEYALYANRMKDVDSLNRILQSLTKEPQFDY